MTQVLIALAMLLGYGLFVLVKPDKQCRKCRGWGHKARRRRRSACPKCKGTGKQFRLGARLVHGGVALLIKHIREIPERREQRAAEQMQDPGQAGGS